MADRVTRVLFCITLSLILAGGAVAEKADFKLRALDGKMVELADLCAKGPVLISFWATYCEPCKKEIPHLFKIVERLSERDLQLVLVSVDSPRSQKRVKPYARGKGWDCPVLLDTNGRIMKQLKGSNPPYTMVVGRNGEVLYAHSGYRPGDEKELEQKLAGMLAAAPGPQDAPPEEAADPPVEEEPPGPEHESPEQEG